MNNINFMNMALDAANKAASRGEVPIGAVIVQSNKILSIHGNRTIQNHDPTAHAEILAIREACEKIGTQRIPNCDLYVTLEPCTMCAAAISFARIRKLVIGATDEKGGAIVNGIKFFDQPTCHHKKIEIITGIESDACSKILKDFFASKR